MCQTIQIYKYFNCTSFVPNFIHICNIPLVVNDSGGTRLNIVDLCFVCSCGGYDHIVAIKQNGKNHRFGNSFTCYWDNVMAYSWCSPWCFLVRFSKCCVRSKFLLILTPRYSLYLASITWTLFIFTQLVFLGFRRWPNNFRRVPNRMILFKMFSS